MESEDNKRIYARIVAKAWADDAFKERFLHEPTKVAREFGMHLPPNAVVVVVESGHAFTADIAHQPPKLTVALPPRPNDLIEHAVLKISTSAFISSKGCEADL